MKKWSILVFTLCLLLLVLAAASAQSPPHRGFLVEGGLGSANVDYGDPTLNGDLAAMQLLGALRVKADINLGLGYAVNDRLYILGSLSGVGDLLESGTNYLQLNTYLYGVGIRWFPFVTGLIVGLDAGGSLLLLDSNLGFSGGGPSGYGASATVAYDFSHKARGVGFALGACARYLVIQSLTITNESLFGEIIWQ